MPRASHSGEGPTERTRPRARRGTSSVMALPGKDWAHSGHPMPSKSSPGLPEPCKYCWPWILVARGGEGTGHTRKEGRWTQSWHAEGPTRILV